MTQLRHVAIALALVAGASSASAQTTVIMREPSQTVITRAPAPSQTIVTSEPLQLTPVQRETIFRTIVREPVSAATPPTVEYRVGARVPREAHLYTVPQTVAVEVPQVRHYRYMVVHNHVMLIDPATSEVVADLGE